MVARLHGPDAYVSGTQSSQPFGSTWVRFTQSNRDVTLRALHDNLGVARIGANPTGVRSFTTATPNSEVE